MSTRLGYLEPYDACETWGKMNDNAPCSELAVGKRTTFVLILELFIQCPF